VSGAAILVRRDVFLDLGGFDEGYFMYYEDIDLCMRAGQRGVAVLVQDAWRVEHLGGHSVGRSTPSLRAAHLRSYQSGRRFHLVHGSSVRGYDILAVVDGVLRAISLLPIPGRRSQGLADLAVARAATRNALGGGKSRSHQQES
jgi:GT2 family glycosyltransferase